MQYLTLGRTGLRASRTGFGALPIQRVDLATARTILRHAWQAGINYFDTARAYSDSETKIGHALADVRADLIIATKTLATTRQGVLADLANSLDQLQTDYVDILQLHNPAELPDPDDPESSYAGLLEARERGLIRHLGITSHRLPLARAAVASDRYETLQYPLSCLSTPADLELAADCRERNMGLIAMKALCGGLVTSAPAAFTFLRQYDNILPIWGIQRQTELDEFLQLEAEPPALDAAMQRAIDHDRATLAEDFCRGCGYCLPCPANIPIPMAARMKFLLGRAVVADFISPDWQQKMRRINDCLHCNVCRDRCPYELDTPALLRKNLVEYEAFLAQHKAP